MATETPTHWIEPQVLQVRRFREGAVLPTRGSDLASGYDLYACIDTAFESHNGSVTQRGLIFVCKNAILVSPSSKCKISTGINLRIPLGFEVQVRPRSGLAAKFGISVMNTPGTVDMDYDGDGEAFEVSVILFNSSPTTGFLVEHGDRIAQMVLCPIPRYTVEEVEGDNLNRLVSNRDGGLGSTGR